MTPVSYGGRCTVFAGIHPQHPGPAFGPRPIDDGHTAVRQLDMGVPRLWSAWHLEVARQPGYSIVPHPRDVSQLSVRQGILRMVAQQRVDGFVFAPPCDNAPDLLGDLRQSQVLLVRVTPHDRGLPLLHVRESDDRAARDATDHLLSLGRLRIGFIVGRSDYSAGHDRTVRQPIFHIAQLACRLLVDLMNGKELPVLHHELPTELVIRESTGPAPEVP